MDCRETEFCLGVGCVWPRFYGHSTCCGGECFTQEVSINGTVSEKLMLKFDKC